MSTSSRTELISRAHPHVAKPLASNQLLAIKTDLHLHTREDREDRILHSSFELINRAAARDIRAISITNHNTFTFDNDLRAFAGDRGVLLIPGIEKAVEGRHVLILNANAATEKLKTFEDLRRAKADGAFLVAPHPFFGRGHCLAEKLMEHLELFDALELSFFYSKYFNLNRRAVQLARARNIAMVGNSDCHILRYLGICHSIIYTRRLTQEDIFGAIKLQNLEIVSKPLPFLRLLFIYSQLRVGKYRVD